MARRAVGPTQRLRTRLVRRWGRSIFAALIKAGYDTTTKVNNGQAGFMHAAASGNAAAVQAVLALVNLQLEARDEDGDTAFVAACGTGNPECVAELIKAGGDATAKDNKGRTEAQIWCVRASVRACVRACVRGMRA